MCVVIGAKQATLLPHSSADRPKLVEKFPLCEAGASLANRSTGAPRYRAGLRSTALLSYADIPLQRIQHKKSLC